MKIQPFKLERYFAKYEFKASYLLNQFAVFKDYTTICSSAPGEILAITALRAKAQIFERNLNIIKNNLRILGGFFAEYAEVIEWHKPMAGPVAFPELKTDIRIADFCLSFFEKKAVMLLPARVYDYPGNHFRIGFARRNMEEALGKFEEFLKEL